MIHAGISTGDDVDDIRKCTGITVLVTLEAFVGILFASMWGAIIFIRLSRIQSFAQVSFSEAIVSQFFFGGMWVSDRNCINSQTFPRT